MISIRNVSYKVDGTTILDDVSIDTESQSVAIIGNNGSGKSTFARLINGLVLPGKGQVLIDGLNTRKALRNIRRKVGFVFQNPDLQFVYPTVEEDLVFGLKNIGLEKFDIDQRVIQTLAHYGLESLRYQSVHSLSGGEKQLLCIASVLIMQPEIVVFDEPTTLLDLGNRRLIDRTIRESAVRKLVVTHDLDYARTVDQVLVMHSGKLVYSGEAEPGINYYLRLIDDDSQ